MNQHRDRNEQDSAGQGNHRKRRWLIVVAVVVAVLALLVALAPTLLSTGPGESYLVGKINERADGRVEIGDLSLGWFSGVDIERLRVWDPNGREVVSAPSIEVRTGLLSLLLDRSDVGEVTVSNPRIALYLDRRGEPSLGDVFPSEPEKEPEPDEPLSKTLRELQLTLRLTDGEIRVISPDGREETIRTPLLTARVDTLDAIDFDVENELPQGRLTARGELRDLLHQQRLAPDRMTGWAEIHTPEPVGVAPLAMLWMGPDAEAAGTVELDGRFDFGADMSGRFDSRLRGFRLAAGEATTAGITLDADLTGQAETRGDLIDAQVRLDSPEGAADPLGAGQASVQLDRSTLARTPGFRELARTIMTGAQTQWPQVKGSIDADLNLATVANAAPAAIGLIDRLRVEQARLTVDGSADLTAAAPSLEYQFELSPLVVSQNGAQRTYPAISGRFSGRLPAGQPLVIDAARIDSDFLELRSSGAADDLRAQVAVDLNQLKSRLSILRFGQELLLDGTAQARLNVARPSERRVTFGVDGRADSITFGRMGAGEPTTIGQATYDLTGAAELTGQDQPDRPGAAQSLRRLALDQMDVEVDGRRVTGSLALDWLEKRLDPLDLTLHRQDSTIRAVGSAGWDAGDKQTTASGNLTLSGQVRRQQGQPLEVEPIDIVAELAADTDKKTIDIRRFSADGAALSLSLDGTIRQYDTRRVLDIQGHYIGRDEALTRLIAALRDDPNQQVQLAFADGQIRHPIRVTGPLNDPDVDPPYRNLQASTAVSWSEIRVPGWTVGSAELPLELSDGVIPIPARRIAVNDGAVNLDGRVALYRRGEPGLDPWLHIPGQLQLVEGVTVTHQVSNLLGRINPVFYRPRDVRGQAHLSVTDVDIPLSEAIYDVGTIGDGRLDVENFYIEPTNLLAQIVRVLGQPVSGAGEMNLPGADFHMADGRVQYDNFIVRWEHVYQIRFRGSVGLDKSLEMVAELPLTPRLLSRGLEQLPNIPVVQSVLLDNLQDVYVPIPVTGSADSPNLQLSRLGQLLEPMIQQVLRNVVQGGGQAGELLTRPVDIIGDILGGGRGGLGGLGGLGGSRQLPQPRAGQTQPADDE